MRSERGYAMIWAMLLVLVVGAASALFFQRSRTMRQAAAADRTRLASIHAAEGGLAHVRVALSRDPGFSGAEIEVGDCRVRSTVRRDDSGWSVRVVATPGGHAVEARLLPREGLPLVRRRN